MRCHDIDQEIVLRITLKCDVAVRLFDDLVDLSTLFAGNEFLQFIGHLAANAHTIWILIVERDVTSFEKEIEKDANCIVVSVDLETIARKINLGAGIPRQRRQFTWWFKRGVGLWKNDIRKLKIIRNLDKLDKGFGETYKFVHPPNRPLDEWQSCSRHGNNGILRAEVGEINKCRVLVHDLSQFLELFRDDPIDFAPVKDDIFRHCHERRNLHVSANSND